MLDQTSFRKNFHGFAWDLLVPSNIDTEIQKERIWEPILTKYIEHHVKPGMNVVDVGANFGWFTLIMASRVTKTGRVHAFEPEPSFFRRLINHLALNFSLKNISDNNVTLYDMALSDELCTRWIVKNPGPYYSSATISETEPGLNIESTLIRCITLDTIWEPEQPLHFIKVDVDGYELKFLKGATRTITVYRPRMILEISKPEDAEEMYQLLKSWNYNIKLESSMRDVSLANLADIRAELKRTTGSINIFAEPVNIGD